MSNTRMLFGGARMKKKKDRIVKKTLERLRCKRIGAELIANMPTELQLHHTDFYPHYSCNLLCLKNER